MNTTPTKIGLSVPEAGWLLQRPEGQIRAMLRRGELTYVVEGRKIDPASIREYLGGEYARLLLDVLLAGGFEVPRPEHRWGPPAPRFPGFSGSRSGQGWSCLRSKSSFCWTSLARTLGPELLGWPTALEASEWSVR